MQILTYFRGHSSGPVRVWEISLNANICIMGGKINNLIWSPDFILQKLCSKQFYHTERGLLCALHKTVCHASSNFLDQMYFLSVWWQKSLCFPKPISYTLFFCFKVWSIWNLYIISQTSVFVCFFFSGLNYLMVLFHWRLLISWHLLAERNTFSIGIKHFLLEKIATKLSFCPLNPSCGKWRHLGL